VEEEKRRGERRRKGREMGRGARPTKYFGLEPPLHKCGIRNVSIVAMTPQHVRCERTLTLTVLGLLVQVSSPSSEGVDSNDEPCRTSSVQSSYCDVNVTSNTTVGN